MHEILSVLVFPSVTSTDLITYITFVNKSSCDNINASYLFAIYFYSILSSERGDHIDEVAEKLGISVFLVNLF